MTYIRNLSQADWFFKDGQEAAASSLPPTPAALPGPTSAAPAGESEEDDEGESSAPPPVLEKKESSLGLYLLGGLGLLAVGGLIYFKFIRNSESAEMVDNTSTELDVKREETLSEAPTQESAPTSSRKRKKKKKKK